MDWSSILGMLSGAGQAGMGIYQGFGGGYNDPSKKANDMLGKIPGQMEPFYSPYMTAGKGAMENLQNQNKGLFSGDVQNQLGSSYKESPGYQFKLQQALGAGNNASAAGGMLGTPMHQQQSMDIANGLASQDYNDYIKNQMGLYNLGYGGEQGINQMGFDANKGMADTIGNVTGQQAGLSYAGEAGKNTYKQGGWNNAMSGLGQASSSAFGIPPWLLEALKQHGQSNQTA